MTHSAELSAQRPHARRSRFGDESLPVGKRTLVMGILNATPDSFYDGGRYAGVQAAVERVHRMVEEGADIIDLGGQSARPFSEPVSTEEELSRVGPILDELESALRIPISIDTCDADVARYAISRGAAIVNDITALTADPEMLPLVAASGVAVILMHMRGTPKTMQADTRYADLVGEVRAYLAERAGAVRDSGVAPDRIAVDPGIGFGKSVAGNLALLSRLDEFRSLGYPVLVGPSRKSFIGKLLDLPGDERLEGSLGAAAAAALNGADILRVHDVRETVRALRIVDAIRRGDEVDA